MISRWVSFTVLICLALGGSAYLYKSERAREDDRIVAEFQKNAIGSVNGVRQSIEHSLHEINALTALFISLQQVERADFKEFVQYLPKHDWPLQALEWIPRVPSSQRAIYEQRARAEGFPDFQITQRESQGAMVRAEARPEYFPVYYVEPYAGNQAALGFDLASDPTRLEALRLSRDRGEKVATPRIRLVQERGEQYGFRVFQPIYKKHAAVDTLDARRKNLQGFVAGAYRIGDVVSYTLAHLPPPGLDIHLFDMSASRRDNFLYSHSARQVQDLSDQPLDHDQLTKGVHYAETFEVAGRQWLAICSPAPDYLMKARTWGPWVYPVGVLLVTGFLFGYAALILSRIDKAREHTAEIEKGKKGLEHEIAERKQIETLLRKEMDKAQKYLDVAGVMLIVIDPSQTVTLINKKGCEILGYEEDEIIGRNWFDTFVPQRIGTGVKAVFKDLVSGDLEPVEYFENPVVTKSGQERTIAWHNTVLRDKDDRILGTLSSGEDITDRKRTEEALQESEEKFKNIFEHAFDGILIADSETKRFLLGNESICRMLGYTLDEIRQLSVMDIHPPEDLPHVIDQFTKMGKEEVSIAPNLPVKRKDGTVFFADIVGSPLSLRGSRYLIGIFRDITKRKTLEEQLAQAQKMEAVGQLAGGISHDFNNILTAIIGYGNILQMQMEKDSPLRPSLDNIVLAAEKAATLTQSLLAFSRKQIIQTKPVELNQVVRHVQKLLARLIGEHIELKTDLAESGPTVLADRGQMEQVLMNLATNARDAMPDGGTITIRTGLAKIDDAYMKAYGYGRPGTYALLSVTDTGTGMDQATAQKIFEPFFTTKPVGKGTGLGLSMAYGIVTQHDGYVTVLSELQKGTTINIYLPLIRSQTEETSPDERAVPPQGTETVLVAEDDEAIRVLLQKLLESAGYTVIPAADGAEALATFAKNPERIHLLLSDLIMPKKNGRDVYEEIKRTKPDMKALFITGYADGIIQQKGVLENGFHLLQKPISASLLLQKVRDVLDGG